MKFKIVPEACKTSKNEAMEEVPPTFEGYVVLDIPKYNVLCMIQKELSKMVIEMKSKKSEEGSVTNVQDSLDAMALCYEKLEPMISEVELRHVLTDTWLRSVDDLSCYPYARGIVQELCLKLMYGFAEKN